MLKVRQLQDVDIPSTSAGNTPGGKIPAGAAPAGKTPEGKTPAGKTPATTVTPTTVTPTTVTPTMVTPTTVTPTTVTPTTVTSTKVTPTKAAAEAEAEEIKEAEAATEVRQIHDVDIHYIRQKHSWCRSAPPIDVQGALTGSPVTFRWVHTNADAYLLALKPSNGQSTTPHGQPQPQRGRGACLS